MYITTIEEVTFKQGVSMADSKSPRALELFSQIRTWQVDIDTLAKKTAEQIKSDVFSLENQEIHKTKRECVVEFIHALKCNLLEMTTQKY